MQTITPGYVGKLVIGTRTEAKAGQEPRAITYLLVASLESARAKARLRILAIPHVVPLAPLRANREAVDGASDMPAQAGAAAATYEFRTTIVTSAPTRAGLADRAAAGVDPLVDELVELRLQ